LHRQLVGVHELPAKSAQTLAQHSRVGRVAKTFFLIANLLIQPAHQIVQVLNVLLDPGDHQRMSRRDEQVDGCLFAASHAGAISRIHREVVSLGEQHG